MISSIETWIDWLVIGGIDQKYLGKNKTSEDAFADYVQGVHTLSLLGGQ
jgi:hypothetical protein